MAAQKTSNIFVCGKDDEAIMRYFEMLTSEISSSEDEMNCDNIRPVAANQSHAADNETDNSSSESGKDNTAVDTSCGDVDDKVGKESCKPMCHPFTALNKYLHLVDNEILDPADPLCKNLPIITMASDSFWAVYTPSRSVCIDESLMKWRGRLHFIQYNKTKRARFRIKFYKLCDSANSYIWDFKIYEQMFAVQFVPIGDMPKELTKEKLKVGEAVAYRSNNIKAMKWKDKREVSMLSTKPTLDFAETGKVHRKMQTKIMEPTAVIDFIQHEDERFSKAYKKIFFYVVDMMLLNGYVLYKRLGGRKDRPLHVFKQKLAEELLESYFKEDVVKRRSATPRDLPSHLSGRHFPEKLAPSAAKGAKFAKHCVVCLEKKQRRESTWKCDSCNVALCI
ncbi:hypothetical protein PR048_013233 [Dryococelus australis]|uniref:PiggyBac transposable element-derived protein domain-containing protein n=1 Tax=Dryococelus australis TaxID=614101 RepID=A0ABQ9HSE6_9NEOP|nr:hypothetical protein PR048_013233 [Dryococelus australis]